MKYLDLSNLEKGSIHGGIINYLKDNPNSKPDNSVRGSGAGSGMGRLHLDQSDEL